MGTAVERASAVSEIRQKAEGYCIRNSQVDGMDVLAVRQATLDAFEYIRREGTPYFLEVLTYRYRGHSMGDPERYRPSEEVRKRQENDPIGIYARRLLADKIAVQEELDQVDALVDAEVAEAVRFAENSPEPAPEALFEHIYAGSSNQLSD
jgi:pyruvate dehydrogenase E1 component alpha subunit